MPARQVRDIPRNGPTQREIVALAIGFGPFQESFTSQVTLDRSRSSVSRTAFPWSFVGVTPIIHGVPPPFIYGRTSPCLRPTLRACGGESLEAAGINGRERESMGAGWCPAAWTVTDRCLASF